MTSTLHLVAGRVRCDVDAERGGRLARLVVDGVDLLVRPPTVGDAHPMMWGCFPMVPWAGRVRNGRFEFGGRAYILPRNLAPHAIHGTVFDRSWVVAGVDQQHAVLTIDLDERWPFGGAVSHEVELFRDRVRCTLTIRAGERSMPAQVGWHPWFVRPEVRRLDFARRYQRDPSGLPTGALVAPGEGPFDDCFIEPIGSLCMTIGAIEMEILSDCSHWTVYDQLDHAVCVEPQSGPPDGFTLSPEVLAPNGVLRRWMEIRWN